REPRETCGRSCDSSIDGWPCRERSTAMVATKSGALSSSVPSRSNNTSGGTRPPCMPGTSGIGHLRLARTGQVVHVGAARQPGGVPPRLVGESAHVLQLQGVAAQPAGQLRGADEITVAVGAPG